MSYMPFLAPYELSMINISVGCNNAYQGFSDIVSSMYTPNLQLLKDQNLSMIMPFCFLLDPLVLHPTTSDRNSISILDS